MSQSLPVVKTPKYELTLPSSKQKISYRPFLVKEEKILLIAMEEADNNAIANAVRQVLEGCTFGKVDVKKLAKIDVEYLFVKVRNKSMGEGVAAVSECVHCQYENQMNLDFDTVQVKYPETTLSDTIQLDDKVWIKMRHPNIDSVYAFDSARDFDDLSLVLAECVVSIINNDAVVDPESFTKEELADWLENLADDSYAKITDFMKNVPKLFFHQEYECVSCGKPNIIHLEELDSFFG